MLLKPVLQLWVAMATAGSAAIQWWHTTFWLWLCVLRGESLLCSDRRGPPRGRKVFSIAENTVALSHLTGTKYVRMNTNVCINTWVQTFSRKHPYCTGAASTLHRHCYMLLFVLWMQWDESIFLRRRRRRRRSAHVSVALIFIVTPGLD